MKKTLLTTLIGGGLALGAVTAYAHGGATGIVKERMDQMVTLREAMKTLKTELAFGGPYDANRVAGAAAAVKRNAGAALTAKFPQGSLSMASEATQAVWSDWARFSALATDLEVYAGALEASAAARIPNDAAGGMGGMGGGMMGGKPDPALLATQPPMAAFMAVSDTCTACHTDFRKKKDN